jgi:hypothetical protein
MAQGKRSKIVGGFTDTVGAQYADPGGPDCFVPGWDKSAGAQQAMDHVRPRARMGQKMTPLGRGTLSKAPGRKGK